MTADPPSPPDPLHLPSGMAAHPPRRAALAAAGAGLAAAVLPGCGTWWGPRAVARDAAGLPPPDLAPAGEQASPARLDALYARGVEALARDDIDAALAAWRDHLRGAPPDAPRSLQLRGYLTLLQRESARRLVRRVTAGERLAGLAPGGRLKVAVFPFAELLVRPAAAGASPAGAGFNRAVAAMVTVDLAKVPALTVLEREKIDHLLDELALARSGLVDPASQPLAARLLGAGSVVAGTVRNEPGPAGPGSGRYRIDSAVSDVAAGQVVGSQQAEGLQSEFFRLQKRVVHGILDTLGVADRPAAVDTVHTRSWAAYGRFARGLALQAEGRFDDARAAFREALALDPGFALAGESLADTPERGFTLAEIRARVGAGR